MAATWTANRNWVSGEIVTASLLNQYVRDNLDWLKTPLASGRISFATDFTTSSASYTDLTGMTTGSITTNGGGFDVYLRVTCSNSASSSTVFQVVIDGVSSALLGSHYNGTTNLSTAMFFEHVAAISAGPHTIKIQVKASSGTTTIKGTTAASTDPHFYVVERGS